MFKATLERLKGRWGSSAPLSILPAARKDDVINDGDRNLPTVRIIRGRDYYFRSTGGYSSSLGFNYGWWDYNRLATEGYGRNSDAYACIDLIAKAAMQVLWWDDTNPVKSYSPAQRELMAEKVRGSGPGREITAREWMAAKHALKLKYTEAQRERQIKLASNPRRSIDLLNASGGAEFINTWCNTVLIYGNAFIEIEPLGSSLRLHQLKPESVYPKRLINPPYDDYENALDNWQVSAYGAPRTVEKALMFHSRLYNPFDNLIGMAPLQAAMLRILLQNEGVEALRRVYKKGSVPGWIELDADAMDYWSEDNIAKLRARLDKDRVEQNDVILGAAQWHERGVKPVDSMFYDAQALSKRDVASVYHVDPALIGDTTARTYATYRESRRGLYMEAVIPLLTLFRDGWNRTIGTMLQSPLEFDKDSFDAIASAREEATDRVVKAWSAGLIDKNESRVDLHYDPVPGADQVYYAPASLVPMETPEEAEARRASNAARAPANVRNKPKPAATDESDEDAD